MLPVVPRRTEAVVLTALVAGLFAVLTPAASAPSCVPELPSAAAAASPRRWTADTRSEARSRSHTRLCRAATPRARRSVR